MERMEGNKRKEKTSCSSCSPSGEIRQLFVAKELPTVFGVCGQHVRCGCIFEFRVSSSISFWFLTESKRIYSFKRVVHVRLDEELNIMRHINLYGH